MKRKIKGFTLIEMIITITVIIILSSISVPIYKSYTYDAIMAEGYVLLSTIREAQKNYYSEYGNFLYYTQSSPGHSMWTSNEEVLDIDARGNKYFTYFSVNCSGNFGGYTAGVGGQNYAFAALVAKPRELWEENNTAMMLQYNISLGQKVVDSPVNVDSSWWD